MYCVQQEDPMRRDFSSTGVRSLPFLDAGGVHPPLLLPRRLLLAAASPTPFLGSRWEIAFAELRGSDWLPR